MHRKLVGVAAAVVAAAGFMLAAFIPGATAQKSHATYTQYCENGTNTAYKQYSQYCETTTTSSPTTTTSTTSTITTTTTTGTTTTGPGKPATQCRRGPYFIHFGMPRHKGLHVVRVYEWVNGRLFRLVNNRHGIQYINYYPRTSAFKIIISQWWSNGGRIKHYYEYKSCRNHQTHVVVVKRPRKHHP